MSKYNWNKVSLKTYARVDFYRRQDQYDKMDRDIAMMSEMTGNSVEHYQDMSLTDLAAELQDFHKFMSQPINPPLSRIFRCKGRTYRVALTKDEISYKDFEQISLLKIDENNLADNCHYIMAQLAKPYDPFYAFWLKKETFTEKADKFKEHLPASIGMGVTLFFWRVAIKLQPILLEQLNKQMTRTMADLSQTLNEK